MEGRREKHNFKLYPNVNYLQYVTPLTECAELSRYIFIESYVSIMLPITPNRKRQQSKHMFYELRDGVSSYENTILNGSNINQSICAFYAFI